MGDGMESSNDVARPDKPADVWITWISYFKRNQSCVRVESSTCSSPRIKLSINKKKFKILFINSIESSYWSIYFDLTPIVCLQKNLNEKKQDKINVRMLYELNIRKSHIVVHTRKF